MKLAIPSLNQTVVSAYKIVGFAVLGVILVGLVSFIGLNAFFFVNHSWVAPAIVSPSDERVLVVAGQLAQQSIARDKLAADRTELAARLAEAKRLVAQQQRFQAEFRGAVEAERVARAAELRNVERVRGKFAAQKPALVRANAKLSGMVRQRADELWQARLVTRDEYIAAGQQASQLAHASLGLEENYAALETRSATLRRDLKALSAILQTIESGAEFGALRQLSYEVLRMEEDYLRSRAELERARATVEVLAGSVAAADASLARYDKILASLRSSPLLHALDGNVAVAFVPYENASAAGPGAPVYGCRLGVLWCRRVGRIVEAIEGEVVYHHPLRNQNERGRMVRLDLTDGVWAKERVLFANRAPLFL